MSHMTKKQRLASMEGRHHDRKPPYSRKADPLILPRMPRFKPTCPKCEHELCGHCGTQYHYDEKQRCNVMDGEYCCKCQFVWDEHAFDTVTP